MDRHLSPAVQMQFLRPRQLEEALRVLPVVYVPFGLIEWHGRHLPLGNDALKAHAILIKCAEQFGGVVYPPVYFPYTRYVKGIEVLHPDEDNWKIAMLTALFNRIKAMGARVIIGVAGHNVPQQIAWINWALEPVVARTAEDMLGLVPYSLREAAMALGAPRWKVTLGVVFRAAKSSLATGALLAVARVSGETAPLLFTSLNSPYWPSSLWKPMPNLTVTIYDFARSPYPAMIQMAWGASLLITLGVLSLTVITRVALRRSARSA
jgi:hypothetical protein